MYYAMRKISRHFWWKQRLEEKTQKAIKDMILHGRGSVRIEW
jgi:hypothetical protein